MDIQGSWSATAPGREEDISRPGERVGDQAGHLFGGSQGGRLGSAEDDVPSIIAYVKSIPTSSKGSPFAFGWEMPQCGSAAHPSDQPRSMGLCERLKSFSVH